MTGPLFYLTVRSIWNGLRVRVLRLRQPRYLLGLVVGGFYFYWFLFAQRPRSGGRSGSVLELASRYHDVFVVVGAVALLVLMSLVWIWPGTRKLRIGFSRADVQFLFTAPISRAALIRYRVLRSQIAVLFGATVMTLFFRPGSVSGGWTFLLGMVTLMATVNLHLVGVSLAFQPDASGPGRWPVRRIARLLLLASCAVVASAVLRSLPPGFDGLETWFSQLPTLFSTGAAGLALWPWKALVQLPLSLSPLDFARHLPFVIAAFALNYVWVIGSRVPFEEAAAEMAERRTSALAGPTPMARRRTAGGRVPFRLAPVGRPEVAFLWKNLLMLGRYVSVLLVVRIGMLLFIVGIIASRTGRGEGVMTVMAGFAFMAAVFATFLGPQIVRIDLRQDLVYLDTLKLWPVRGAELVRGEVLAPTLLLSGVVWLALLMATALGRNWQVGGASWLVGGPWSWAFGAMWMAAGLILAQVIAQNAVAVAFPAWARIGGGRPQGIDVMGQRMLMLAGMVAVLALAAIPAALIAAIAGAAVYALTGTVPVLVCAACAAGTLLVEAVVATEALGALLDRTDVTALDARE